MLSMQHITLEGGTENKPYSKYNTSNFLTSNVPVKSENALLAQVTYMDICRHRENHRHIWHRDSGPGEIETDCRCTLEDRSVHTDCCYQSSCMPAYNTQPHVN